MEQVNGNTKTRIWQQLTEAECYKNAIRFKAKLKSRLASDSTIEREVVSGRVEQKRLNPNSSKSVEQPLYLIEYPYKAGYAQMRHDERSANKGRNLKIGQDHRLADYIEYSNTHEHYSPDAIIGRIRSTGMKFDVSICIKTIYNYIDMNIFRKITNIDLWNKWNKKKRNYKK